MIDDLTFNVAQLLKEPIGATRNGQVAAGLFGLVPELEQMAPAAHGKLDTAVPPKPDGTMLEWAGEPVLTGPASATTRLEACLAWGLRPGRAPARHSGTLT